MDEEMEDRVEYTFTVVEIDLDYEFDAARYFDFSREETVAETSEAELWFESAGSYPPSPFITKLIQGDISRENVNISPKPKDVENMILPGSDSDIDLRLESSVVDVSNRDFVDTKGGIFTHTQSESHQKFRSQPLVAEQVPTGLVVYSHLEKDNLRATMKSSMKPSFPRSSTLMKPTESQLAKQNRSHQVADSRFQKLVEYNDKGSNSVFGIESQAAKRQKLEGGHLHKVAGMKQQTNLIHKAPKRHVLIQKTSINATQRLTVPREPDLETAQRAERMRPKANHKVEQVISTIHKFKARPLNRKILDAPSFLPPKRTTPRLPEFQEFHLKTSERAVHHTLAVSSSSANCSNSDKVLIKPNTSLSAECQNREPKRGNSMDIPKQEGGGEFHNFKALPLNKKIFSSKGDMGIFRNIKKDITVPMEFNFHAGKRVQHELPIELFNKLSLTSEVKSNAGSTLKLPLRNCLPAKGSKENRFGSFQQECEVKQLVKGKQPMLDVRQIQCGSDWGTEVAPLSDMGRSLGIR